MDIQAGRYSAGPKIAEAQGAWVIDASGKRYVDYLLGNCCHVLGHSYPSVVEAICRQARTAINVGDRHTEAAYALAQLILDAAHKDALRFVNSGSEAVHLALRVARASTGRRIIVKFEGHYHGWFAEELSRFVPTLPRPGGLTEWAGHSVISLPWNDSLGAEKAFEKYGPEIACVICEPMLCHAGPIPPREGFLARLRELTKASGALLIFDECITGFRLSYGGAQAEFGIQADIVTYSKTLSAGIPFGVCAGTAEAMGVLAEGGTAYQEGTYDANPLSVAAARAVIDVLRLEPPYAKMRDYGSALRDQMGSALREYGIKHIFSGHPVVFQFFKLLDNDPIERVDSHSDALGRTDTAFYARLQGELVKGGINVFVGDVRPNQPSSSWLSQWFMSGAHGREELDFTVRAFRGALDRVSRGG